MSSISGAISEFKQYLKRVRLVGVRISGLQKGLGKEAPMMTSNRSANSQLALNLCNLVGRNVAYWQVG